MPRRAATVTQADIARAIRAVQAAGLPVLRVVVRSDGVVVETIPYQDRSFAPDVGDELASEERVIDL